jgi:acyl-CoA reductase-like NAD-dependent aldehyde dehydrogenase
MKAYKILINGKWINSDSKETFQSLNPATEQALGQFQSGNENDINRAVDAAERSFEEDSFESSLTTAPGEGAFGKNSCN